MHPLANISLIVILLGIIISGCSEEQPIIERETKIPADAVKMTPETDDYPPILHSDEYENPVPLAVINTAGAEDSPFIPADRDELYFVFVSDVRLPVEKQILDGVTGIYVSKKVNGAWQEPELIISQFAGEPTLDNEGNVYFVHHFYKDGQMIEADIYIAYRK